MREIIILALIAAAGYLAYDDYYKQRPALEQARAEIQQLRENTAHVGTRVPTYGPPGHATPPTWFQKRVNQGSSLDAARQHTQEGERASTPPP